MLEFSSMVYIHMFLFSLQLNLAWNVWKVVTLFTNSPTIIPLNSFPLDPTKPANPSIPSRCARDDYQSYISNCFKLVSNPMTYADAERYCQQDATELASFSDKYEQAFVQTTMYANGVEGVWLGMTKEEVSGLGGNMYEVKKKNAISVFSLWISVLGSNHGLKKGVLDL